MITGIHILKLKRPQACHYMVCTGKDNNSNIRIPKYYDESTKMFSTAAWLPYFFLRKHVDLIKG